MRLTSEEQAILDGEHGKPLQKAVKAVVLYGEAVGASHLVDIEGEGHFSISDSTPGVSAPLELLTELTQANLRTKFDFTLDPKEPLDFKNLGLTEAQKIEFRRMYPTSQQYQHHMRALGLKNRQAYTCSPYVFEDGNIPQFGQILAWSESSCVVYANSALGARTNRTAAILDLLSNIVGKTPYFGLLTDEGRKAERLIEVKTETLPHPQLLATL